MAKIIKFLQITFLSDSIVIPDLSYGKDRYYSDFLIIKVVFLIIIYK